MVFIIRCVFIVSLVGFKVMVIGFWEFGDLVYYKIYKRYVYGRGIYKNESKYRGRVG